MTREQLAAIEARAAQATPGPWVVEKDDHEAWEVVGGVRPVAPYMEFADARRAGTDAAFIAASRTDVPALVAALRAERAEAAGLRDALGRLLTLHDGPCRLDHEGFCQGHGLGRPCEVALARAALEGREP